MTLAQWRDLSVVLLSLEVFILSLIPAAILYGLIRGILWLIAQVRHYGPIVRGFFRTTADAAAKISHKVSAPIIAAGAAMATVQRWSRILSRSPHS